MKGDRRENYRRRSREIVNGVGEVRRDVESESRESKRRL